MTDDTDITDWKADIERYIIRDKHGDAWAVANYIPPQTPQTRFDEWMIDFRSGDRLTGQVANEVARIMMNDDQFDGEYSRDFPDFGMASDPMLNSVVYDDDSRQYRITVRGVRVWFDHAERRGDDIVLYADEDRRAGVIEDAPFDLPELRGELSLARRKVING
jgi:hypothetical protein